MLPDVRELFNNDIKKFIIERFVFYLCINQVTSNERKHRDRPKKTDI